MGSICDHKCINFDAQMAHKIASKEKWKELYQYFNQKFGKVEFLIKEQSLAIYTLQVYIIFNYDF